MSLADNLKALQSLKNLTTAEFAEKANLPVDTINKIRAGTTQNPNMDTLSRMAAALECSIDDLVGKPKADEKIRSLLPDQIPAEPEALVSMICGTLHRQAVSHDKTLAEVRKDRNWWRIACICLLICVIAILVFFYWDLSHPTMGNIRYFPISQ